MIPITRTALLLFALACQAAQAATPGTLDLSGEWRFALDREDRGIAEQWQARTLPDRMSRVLPPKGDRHDREYIRALHKTPKSAKIAD